MKYRLLPLMDILLEPLPALASIAMLPFAPIAY
jgi:hypothetical protein